MNQSAPTASQQATPLDNTQSEKTVASVSVVVPIRNEEQHIASTLDQLLSQDHGGNMVEILVVDGRSTDRTREIVGEYAKRFPHVRQLDNPNRLSSSARNIAINNSLGEYLVIIDGHCEIPTRTYFLDLINAFEQSSADCLGRPQPLNVSHATALQRAIAAARSSRLGHHPDSFIYSEKEVSCPAASVAVAYRKTVFDQVGMFDERFDACEDYELNYRIDEAGLSCRLIPKLTVNYKPRKTLGGLFRQLFRYGRGRVRLFRKHRAAITFKTLMPAALIAGIVAGPLLCIVIPSLWPTYFLSLAIYLTATFVESIRLAAVWRDLRILPWLPAVFVAIHFGSGCGLLREIGRPS